jgi:glutamate-ammonia-ligase adenylyltransferase
MIDVEFLVSDLPDQEAARRFLSLLENQRPSDATKLKKNEGLLSDVLTLASYSPLLGTTLLQNPEYIWWLSRKRHSPAVRRKEELLEALGRFVLTNSQLDLHAQLARFRRRELLRIFLSDIRRLMTMAEITEEISNLADAILETALRRAEQDTSNRFGTPQVTDHKGKKTAAEFCIVSLGKLGSRELNYASDIDLLFLYSAEGETSGSGSRGSVTNREYFIKLSETIVNLVGSQRGEGAAYRVDMRLRPHGRVGPLAISVNDAVKYYTSEARDWERQVLIRSRSSAGDAELYKRFFERVENAVFVSESEQQSDYLGDGQIGNPQSAIRNRLENVRRSKVLIDSEQRSDRGFNVKLGRGGIREIEFIAQALQLAYGGTDRWLRASHTLISLSRLADRGLITEAELTELFNAYEFLRHLEHILQMENGLQTHTIPEEPDRRALIGRRMRCETTEIFDGEISNHTSNVHRIFERVFGTGDVLGSMPIEEADDVPPDAKADVPAQSPANTHDVGVPAQSRSTANDRDDYSIQLQNAIQKETDFRHRLGAFRRRWADLLDDIKTAELDGILDMREAKRAQTRLAEASIETALDLTRREIERRYKTKIENLRIGVIGLGKLGGGAIDYGSDLDLVLVYDDVDQPITLPHQTTEAEFYSRAAEIFVTTLSSMTRDGSIYRVDLRLRPYGKNGQSVISASAFAGYMRETAAIWEWLAYVKIRAVGGDIEFARHVEQTIRGIIHDRAARIDPVELASETLRVRTLLEKEKVRVRRSKDIDIKYGPGGLLDVYFAMRYVQLRDNIPDRSDNRSTEFMLGELHREGALSQPHYETISAGYRFLSELDHNLRLLIDRTTRLPLANTVALDDIARRMNLEDHNSLVEHLTLHRINLRKAFEEIVC